VQGVGLLLGVLGVELFFVLSGFLIGGILIADFDKAPTLSALRHFWVRRWFRTLPNYFLFVGVNVLLALGLGSQIPAITSYLVFLQSFSGPPPPFFVESWSLAVEEWFYLLMPVAALIGIRCLRLPLNISVLLVGVLAIAGVTMARSWYVAAYQPAWLLGIRVITPMRLDACMFGVLGAWLLRYHPKLWAGFRRPGLLLGSCLLLVITLNIFDPEGGYFSMKTTGFTVLSLSALCFLPALEGWRASGGRMAAGTTRLSLWSYSLYLVNFPVFTLCSHVLAPQTPAAALACATAFVAVSIALAALIYHYFERPVLKLRDSLSQNAESSTHFRDGNTSRPTVYPYHSKAS
jgi:peptidoglycan/LPS O-acetylase OafA/YrhL